ncbi:MAG TPA: hypothetical protein VIL74_20450 [Pyrinomonadaceae bacterium]|jgi:hypothetical protein
MAKNAKILISNDSERPLLISLEPWGEDYTLLAKEEVEIIAADCPDDFHYNVVYYNDFIAVYVEGGSGNEYPRVYRKGVELKCGYNREFSPDNFRRDDILEAGELE